MPPLAQELHNIFANKYLPILRKLPVRILHESETKNTDTGEVSLTAYKIYTKVGEHFLAFADFVSKDETKWATLCNSDVGTILMPSNFLMEFDENLMPKQTEPTDKDWEKFYELLNKLMSVVLSELVVEQVSGTAFYSEPYEAISIENTGWVEIQFDLNQIQICFYKEIRDKLNGKAETSVTIPLSEGDIEKCLQEVIRNLIPGAMLIPL